MSDDRVRDLERAYRASGDPADRLRWLEAKARSTGRERDALGAALAAFDAGALQRRVDAFLEARWTAWADASGVEELEAWRRESIRGAEALFRREPLGTRPELFWPGQVKALAALLFDDDPEPEWTQSVATRVVTDWERRARYATSLLEEWEAHQLPDEASHFLPSFRILVRDALNAAMEETGCDDAWYTAVSWRMTHLFEEEGVALDLAGAGKLRTLVTDHFRSWCQAEPEEIDVFTDQAAALVVRLKFAERYGTA